jgi:hypothetical protein
MHWLYSDATSLPVVLSHCMQETRWLTTLIMLVFVALTLMAAFWWDSAGLCFLFVFCQFLAWIWYAPMIPYWGLLH